jgi:hypothetical protein
MPPDNLVLKLGGLGRREPIQPKITHSDSPNALSSHRSAGNSEVTDQFKFAPERRAVAFPRQ